MLSVVIAAAAAGALVVTFALPAGANPVGGLAGSTARSSRSGPAQSLTVPQGSTIPTVRDSMTATTEAELATRARQDPAGVLLSEGSGPIRWPFPGTVPISDGFGSRAAPCSGCSSNHLGLDMTPGGGVPIAAVAAGVVRWAEEADSGFGVNVMIDHLVNGERFSSLYAHMQSGSLRVSAGQTVTVGQIIGVVGSTGASTGNHLHLEIWDGGQNPIDPYPWLREHAS